MIKGFDIYLTERAAADSLSMSATLSHELFGEGADEVNFEQFCQIIDALEQDVTAKLRRVFNKYDEDGGGTMDAGELEKIFADLGMAISAEQIDAAVFEFSGGEDEVDFEQFLARARQARLEHA